MSDMYILNGKTPEPCTDLLAWGKWLEKANRHVNITHIGEVKISTVFLGLDHNWAAGPPLLFETMIFGGDHDGYQDRYATWDEAEAGHIKAVCLVKQRTRERTSTTELESGEDNADK